MDPLEVALRLGVAALLTAVVGIDRELRAKPAGLRTNIVVGTATAAYAYVGAVAVGDLPGDATRIAAQVVSGIGFLGGGAIFASGGKPSGLTTAAALWGSAAIGLAAGLGLYDVAVLLLVIMMLTLWPVDRLVEHRLRRRSRHELRLHIVLQDLEDMAEVQSSVSDLDVGIVEQDIREIVGRPVLDLRLSGAREGISRAVSAIEQLPGVSAVTYPVMSWQGDAGETSGR